MLEILSLLGSVASIASFAIQIGVPRRSDGTPDLQAIEPRLQDELPEDLQPYLQDEAAMSLVRVFVIHPEVLDTINEEIDKARKDYIGGIKAPNAQKRDAADAIARRRICEQLNRILDLNDDEFPHPIFAKEWKSYRCERIKI